MVHLKLSFDQVLLPEKLVHLLVGVEPKDTTKPKIWRRKDFSLLVASRETPGIFPKAVSSQTKIRKVLSSGYIHPHEGLGCYTVQALVDSSQEGHKRSTLSSLKL